MNSFPFFNAHHSPIGAFASLTLGCKGAKGGLGLELAGPANESLFIGCEDREKPGSYRALPFFELRSDAELDYHLESADPRERTIEPFLDTSIARTFKAATDEWAADDLTVRIISMVAPVPDPDETVDGELADVVCPAVLVELCLDNRGCDRERIVFFGYEGSDRSCAMRVIDGAGLAGVGQGLQTAVITSDEMRAGIAWDPIDVLEPAKPVNLNFLLGSIGMLVGRVAPDTKTTFRLAVCFHRAGTVTAELATRYLYNRWFGSVEEVARHALDRFSIFAEAAKAADEGLSKGLSQARALSVAHAVRSYYGSTQLLQREDGRALWIVNEGEYRMMGTCDLTADQAFYELRMNPWTVRNELDFYAERYSYEDSVRFPGEAELHPGGLAFTHDVGVGNVFSRPGYSAYEKAGITDCFSYMSCEELTNWVLIACLYYRWTSDDRWLKRNADLLEKSLQSLCNRDHPDPEKRNGVMGLDTCRCEGGAEITTYDSLDVSLGRARGNLYLAVKWWSAFAMLHSVFQGLGRAESAEVAWLQAERSARTVVASVDKEGALPAVLGYPKVARIIPVIEGLVFPMEAGMPELLDADGPFAELVSTLGRHLHAVLTPGICKFGDGAWKLSSTSDSSWLSKIYLCMHVAERLFGIRDSGADKAHWGWLMDAENVYFAWSDQMVAGKAKGSRYYPRGVTSVLWTQFRAKEADAGPKLAVTGGRWQS